MYCEVGRPADAVKPLNRAVTLAPKNIEALNCLGAAHFLSGAFSAATGCFEKVLGLDPNNAYAHATLGKAVAATNPDRAIRHLEKAIELDPKDSSQTDARLVVGLLYLAKGDLQRAIDSFKSAIALNPKHAVAHRSLGIALVGKGEHEQGIDWLKKALILAPADVETHNNLLASLTTAKRVRAAVATVAAARRATRKEDWPQLRYNAACAFALAGTGQGDAATLEAAEKSRLRKQALAWLRDEMKHWAAHAKSARPNAPGEAANWLRHVQKDDDFAGVRAAGPLAALDADERKEWQQLWTEVKDLLAAVGAPGEK
jgi:Tfp pilus assembly protein PilF